MLCEPGLAVGGLKRCKECLLGFIAAMSGQHVCRKCTGNTFSGPEATECQTCPAGTQGCSSAGSNAECIDCLAGFASKAGDETVSFAQKT